MSLTELHYKDTKPTLTANSPIAQQALLATETDSVSLEVLCIYQKMCKAGTAQQ